MRFISGFADIAKPLSKLTEEKQTFEWATEAETAFQALKDALCTAPVLGYPRPGEQFIFDTDASNMGIGGVLSQVQDGSERVVACFSKTLLKAERNYCVTRRESLAIVKTLENFHKYLYGLLQSTLLGLSRTATGETDISWSPWITSRSGPKYTPSQTKRHQQWQTPW
jgi:hypothetical protein